MKSRILFIGLFWLASAMAAQAQPMARIQFIHNSADLNLSQIDIWVDGVQWVDNLPFREATAYMDIPSGVPVSLGVAPENSASEQDTLIHREIHLQPHDTVIVHIHGTTDPSAYQPYVALNMQLIDQRREKPHYDQNQIDLFFLFGCSDEGKVDIRQGIETLVSEGQVGVYSDYYSYDNSYHVFRRTDESGRVVYGTYGLPLDQWAWPGRTAVVLSSGFQDPSQNQNGPPMAIMAVSHLGGPFIELPPAPRENYARLQIMQNAADLLIDTLDVYMEGIKLIDDLPFRHGSEFLDVISKETIRLGFAPANSQSVLDTFHSVIVYLDSARTYLGVTNGIESSVGYAPRPPFQFSMIGLNEEIGTPGEVQFHVHHGTTDFPIPMDLREGQDVLYNSMVLGGFSLLHSRDLQDTRFTLTSDDGSEEILKYNALFSQGFDGELGLVLSSGFWVPAANSQGPAFGLYFASTKGGPFQALPIATGIEDLYPENASWSLYPNPASHQQWIRGRENQIPESLELYSLEGKKLPLSWNRENGSLDLSALNPGVYLIRVVDQGTTQILRMVRE